jgi:hypothetical protein
MPSRLTRLALLVALPAILLALLAPHRAASRAEIVRKFLLLDCFGHFLAFDSASMCDEDKRLDDTPEKTDESCPALRFSDFKPDVVGQADGPGAAAGRGGHANEASLLLNEWLPDDSSLQVLVRYRFQNGILAKKEIAYTELRTRKYFSEFSECPIVRNRYLITYHGEVLDMAAGRILNFESGPTHCIGLDGSKVIICAGGWDDWKVDFAVFDLDTRRREKLADAGVWGLPGVRSPARDKSVMTDGSNVYLFNLDGSSVLIGRDFRHRLSIVSSGGGFVPLLWLDNDRILTQRAGRFVILHTDKTVEPLCDLPLLARLQGSNPTLKRTPDGTILYDNTVDVFTVDMAGRRFARWKPPAWSSLGHGFDREYKRNSDDEQVFRYNGREIGRMKRVSDVRTAEGHVALRCLLTKDGEPSIYPIVKVWTASTGKWLTLDTCGPELVAWTD